MNTRRNPSLSRFPVKQLSFIGGNTGYINLEEWVEVFGVSTLLASAEVLGTLHLHEEEVQVLAGLNYLKSSRGGGCPCSVHWDMQAQSKERTILTSIGLRMSCSDFGHISTSFLLGTSSPSCTVF